MTSRRNSKQILVDNSSSIKKSNVFSMAKINQGLTLNQMQLLAYCIYATQKDNKTVFDKADFEAKFGIVQYKRESAQVDADALTSLKVSTDDLDTDHFSFKNVFVGAEYNKGVFSFEWTSFMLPHVLTMQDKYVLTDLALASQFKSAFTWTLYDFIRANYGCWYKVLSKKELINLFSIDKKASYQKNTALFKKYVINTAIGEINEYTELQVKCEDIKSGRSIVGFKLLWSKGTTIAKASEKQIEILRSLIDAVFADTLMYMEIENDDDKNNALVLIKELQKMKREYLEEDIGLTSELYTRLSTQAKNHVRTLNRYLEQPISMDVPLFDWLNGDD